MEMILFYLVSFILVSMSLMVVFTRDLFNAAVFLILAMVQSAVLFCVFHAYFLAIVQLIVYAGAVMVLFLFIIMLVSREKKNKEESFIRFKSAPLMILLIFLIEFYVSYQAIQKDSNISHYIDITWIGDQLFGPFLFPFEVISLVLLVAVVGVSILAKGIMKGSQE